MRFGVLHSTPTVNCSFAAIYITYYSVAAAHHSGLKHATLLIVYLDAAACITDTRLHG